MTQDHPSDKDTTAGPLPGSEAGLPGQDKPRTDWVDGVLERDAMGFILTGPDLLKDGQPIKGWPLKRAPYWLEASVPGVFVAGDVRSRSVKRMATAVGEGSMAVQFIHQYRSTLEPAFVFHTKTQRRKGF